MAGSKSRNHVDRKRNAYGNAITKQNVERQSKRKSQVIEYHVSIENINIYLKGGLDDLIPKEGKFITYTPQKGRRKKD